MDLSKEVLTVFFLNAAGYLAVGGLLLVIFTFFRDRKKATSDPAGLNLQATDHRRGEVSNSTGEGHRIEFIKFGEQPFRADTAGASDVHSKRAPSKPVTSRRNHIEVMGLARKMINAGASAEKISAVLPISEAELALLSSQKN